MLAPRDFTPDDDLQGFVDLVSEDIRKMGYKVPAIVAGWFTSKSYYGLQWETKVDNMEIVCIAIAKNHRRDSRLICQTIYHEICHTVIGDEFVNGRRIIHGRRFKILLYQTFTRNGRIRSF